ncbi:MAG: tetratricopeptide repeat protein [Oculatellaceae cyanobacterium bins.114]|nr:tetratricopeptide repeat protein [Oculatellaceae cyanobacterium bins.114]
MSNLLPDGSTADDYYKAGLNQGVRDSRQAITYFLKALELNPNHLNACCELAERLSWTGEWSASLDYYDRAIAINPEVSTIWSCRATVLHQLQYLDEALESYNRAIALDPEQLVGDIWMGKAAILAELGQLEEAVDNYDRAIALYLNPEEESGGWVLDDCYAEKGDVLFELGRYEEAIASYNQAVGLKAIPEDNRMKAYVALGREGELLELYDQNDLAFPPEWVWEKKGDVLMHANRYEEALECYWQAHEYDPNRSTFQLEQVLQRLGYRETDITNLIQARTRLSSSNRVNFIKKSDLNGSNLTRFTVAQAGLEKIRKKFPGIPSAYLTYLSNVGWGEGALGTIIMRPEWFRDQDNCFNAAERNLLVIGQDLSENLFALDADHGWQPVKLDHETYQIRGIELNDRELNLEDFLDAMSSDNYLDCE